MAGHAEYPDKLGGPRHGSLLVGCRPTARADYDRRVALPRLQMPLGGLAQLAEAGPGEPHDQSFIDVGQPGMGQMVPKVIQVSPDAIGTYRPPDCGAVSQCFVTGRDPQSVQDPAVAGIVGETGGVALTAKGRNLAQQRFRFKQRVTVGADIGAHNGVAVTKSGVPLCR